MIIIKSFTFEFLNFLEYYTERKNTGINYDNTSNKYLGTEVIAIIIKN